jgi:tetratricopeptide (TPR) repeat protein
MAIVMDKLLLKLVPIRPTRLISLLVLTLLGSLFLLPLAGFTAQNSLAVNKLKQKAQHAYSEGRYGDAAAINVEIAEKHPESEAARYAVQMLGTLYEDNIVDIKKAIKWDREFLEKYADPRQISFYKEKLASLEKLMQQEEAFKTYQKIRFDNQGDEIMAKKFEALLKEHPDFLLKDKIQKELGYAYTRLDKRRQSYIAFQALSSSEKKLSSSDQVAYETASRYWNETSAWGWVAWGVIVVLWAVALLMNPWQQLTRSSIRNFLLLTLLWTLLTAIRMPTFYSLETMGDPIVIPDTVVYIAASLNLTVLLWLFLLTRGKFWQTRPRALHWLSPILTLLMSTAVFYLVIIHQPTGPQIIDVFADTYRGWAGELWHP